MSVVFLLDCTIQSLSNRGGKGRDCEEEGIKSLPGVLRCWQQFGCLKIIGCLPIRRLWLNKTWWGLIISIHCKRLHGGVFKSQWMLIKFNYNSKVLNNFILNVEGLWNLIQTALFLFQIFFYNLRSWLLLFKADIP